MAVDAITERENAVIKAMLSAFVNKRASDWDEVLPAVLMAYRSSIHRTLNETPNALMLGRQVRLPVDVMVPPPPEVAKMPLLQTEYAGRLADAMKDAQEVVSAQLGDKYAYQQRNYDRHVRPQCLTKGQAVSLRVYPGKVGQSKSLLFLWDHCWVITACLSAVHYKIQKTLQGNALVVHGDRLKPFLGEIAGTATKRLWLSLQSTADRVDRLAVLL